MNKIKENFIKKFTDMGWLFKDNTLFGEHFNICFTEKENYLYIDNYYISLRCNEFLKINITTANALLKLNDSLHKLNNLKKYTITRNII